MLYYNGYLKFDTPLSEEEVTFLNSWQQEMHKAYYSYKNDGNENSYSIIEQTLGIYFNESQKWTLSFMFNPMISFDKNGIIVKGEAEKGQLRESILAYSHFFIGENAVLKKCLSNSDIFKVHKFNGIIEAEKEKYGKTTNWCYIAEDSNIYSVDAYNKEEYLSNKENYNKTYKEDTCQEKLDMYFPPIYSYINIKEAVYNASNNNNKVEKRNKI